MLETLLFNKKFLSCHIRWENHQTSRYYQAFLQNDLFNDLVLTKAWGGINNKRGGQKNYVCINLEEAALKLHQMDKKRLKRGYFRSRVVLV